MTPKNQIPGIMVLVLAAVLLLGACEKRDGQEFDPARQDDLNEFYGFKTCESSVDCGVGRFCDETAGICDAECTTSRDCYFMDTRAQQAWAEAKAQGKTFEEAELPPPAYKCSPCGTCIAVEEESDPRCVVIREAQCKTDLDCVQELGKGYACNQDEICTRTCKEDRDCDAMGLGHRCAEDGSRMLCEKWCWHDSSCAYHGFHWGCVLPDGVDQTENYWSHDSVYGRCVPRADGVDWGEHVDEEKPSSKLTGVYATVMSLAFTNCGFPLVNCQDSTNVHHILFKFTQDEDGSVHMEGKYCTHIMWNFKVDSNDPTRDQVFDDISWMEVPTRYTLSIPFHVWNMSVTGDVGVGTKLNTDVYLEVRGALLDDPVNDPLPTKDDLTNAWDQDRDGLPGVTTFMSGILTGEVYNVNRAYMQGFFEVVATDADGTVTKLQGLLTTENESGVIGASKPSYIVNVEGEPFADPDRSYMRFRRVPDDTNCTNIRDIIGLEERREVACGPVNERYISIENDDKWLCYTPTIGGPNPQ